MVIATAADLPAIGKVTERSTLDFKAQATSDPYEIAKDVAAMANANGGAIILGAATQGEFLRAYLPISRAEASQVQRTVEEAVKVRCFPRPLVTVTAVEFGDGFVVVVHIEPFPGQLVGVRITQGEAKCGSSGKQPDHLFYFPVRVASHTVGITPEQLPMYLDARIRRIAIYLQQTKGKRVMLRDASQRGEGNERSHWMPTAEVLDVDVMHNSVTFSVDGHGGKVEPERDFVSVPLDFVSAVWKDAKGWKVMLLGRFRPVEWGAHVTDEMLKRVKWFFAPASP